MFKCSACEAKNEHIVSLKSEIENLRKLVFPQAASLIPPGDPVEADAIMSGSDDPDMISIPRTREQELLDDQDQLIKVMTGTYDVE